MGETANGFAPLLWGWSALLLLYAVDRLCSLQAQRLRPVLPLLLLLCGLWLSSDLFELALRGQARLNSLGPLHSLEHAFEPHPS